MPFSGAPYDSKTIDLMVAALEIAWVAARLGIPGISHVDRADMERAILNAAASGERNFKQLQQHAIDALGARAVEAAVGARGTEKAGSAGRGLKGSKGMLGSRTLSSMIRGQNCGRVRKVRSRSRRADRQHDG